MNEQPKSSQPPVLNIIGERVALGPLRRELLPVYQRWINDFGTARNLELPPGPLTAERELDWYELQSRSDSYVPFTIYERGDLRPIGNTGLQDIDYRNRRATFGILIGEPNFRGMGLGTEATRLVLDYAFTALGLYNVMLTVFAHNHAGIRAYEKAGFREFGRRRECRMVGGRLRDQIYMDCIAPEFEGSVLAGVFRPDEPR